MYTKILSKDEIKKFCDEIGIDIVGSILLKIENDRGFYVINGVDKKNIDISVIEKYI